MPRRHGWKPTSARGSASSRPEHAIDRFDAEVAEERRAVVENTRRIADYQPRLGGGFTLAGELASKLAEFDPAPNVPSFISRIRSPYAPGWGVLQRLLG